MNTLRRAIGNSTVMLVGQLITWTASIFLIGALGRHLGDTGFGQLYLAMSFGVIFSVLVEFGLDQQLVRAVARDRNLAGSYLINSMAIKVVLAAVAYAMILGLSQVLGYAPEVRTAIAVYCVILVFNGLSASLAAVYRACENVFHSSMGQVLEKLFVAFVAVFLLRQGYGVVAMAAVFVAGMALNVTWKAFFLRRLVRIDWAVDPRTMRRLVVGALPFFLYWALGAVYYRIDIVLLSKLTDATVVGWYGAAYKLFDTLIFLPGIVSATVMFPILARLSVQSRDDLRLALEKGLNVILLLGVPISTGLFVLAEPIIRFIYRKPEFLPAVPALRYLAIALGLLYVNSVLAAALVSLHQEKKMTLVAGLATSLNLGLNWLLIPHFQHLAAATVTVGTETFILCCLLVLVPKDLLSRSSLIVFLKTATAAVAMAGVLYGLRGQSLPLLVLVGGLVYVLVGLLLRVVPPEDFRLFKQVIVTRRGRGVTRPEAAHV